MFHIYCFIHFLKYYCTLIDCNFTEGARYVGLLNEEALTELDLSETFESETSTKMRYTKPCIGDYILIRKILLCS